jgi:hypothetical protein
MEEEAEKIVEEKEHELLEKAEVSLILDKYEDIFSDFDPRPFTQRAFSVDFLDEAKRATRDIEFGAFQLRFMLPKTERNSETEYMVRRRLREHFKKHHEMLRKEKSKIVKQGLSFIGLGILFMLVAAFVLYRYHNVLSLMKELLIVMLEPGGWFLFWEGLELVIFKSKVVKPDLNFYKKMTNAEIIFSYY